MRGVQTRHYSAGLTATASRTSQCGRLFGQVQQDVGDAEKEVQHDEHQAREDERVGAPAA